jgi:hypothetical protein
MTQSPRGRGILTLTANGIRDFEHEKSEGGGGFMFLSFSLRSKMPKENPG